MHLINNTKYNISIIIPIYNVAPYLSKSLNSVISQTYKDYEVILINDGSTDDSLKIAEEFSGKYSNFHLYSQTNQGLSAARNYGASLAKGEYICFLDSDDYLEQDYLEKMVVEAQRSNSDMLICDYYNVNETGDRQNITMTCPYPNGIVDKGLLYEALTKVGENHFATAIVVAWNKLIRADIIKSIPYPVGKIHEDEFIIFDLITRCNQISWISDTLYAYVTRSNGIMHTLSYEAILKRLNVLDAYSDRIGKSYDVNPEMSASFWRAYYHNCRLYLSWFSEECESYQNQIRKNISKRYFKTYSKYFKYLSFKNKIIYLLRGIKNITFYSAK